jgi:hypothetical protein
MRNEIRPARSKTPPHDFIVKDKGLLGPAKGSNYKAAAPLRTSALGHSRTISA